MLVEKKWYIFYNKYVKLLSLSCVFIDQTVNFAGILVP